MLKMRLTKIQLSQLINSSLTEDQDKANSEEEDKANAEDEEKEAGIAASVTLTPKGFLDIAYVLGGRNRNVHRVSILPNYTWLVIFAMIEELLRHDD
jgi:hypothetical protein